MHQMTSITSRFTDKNMGLLIIYFLLLSKKMYLQINEHIGYF